MKKTIIVFTLFLLALFLFSVSVVAYSPKEENLLTEYAIKRINTPLNEQDVFEEFNKYRKTNGLNETQIDNKLCEYAKVRVKEIQIKFSHDSFIKTSLAFSQKNNYKYIGENLSAKTKNPISVIFSWNNSPKHKEIMLEPHITKSCVICENNYCVLNTAY